MPRILIDIKKYIHIGKRFTCSSYQFLRIKFDNIVLDDKMMKKIGMEMKTYGKACIQNNCIRLSFKSINLTYIDCPTPCKVGWRMVDLHFTSFLLEFIFITCNSPKSQFTFLLFTLFGLVLTAAQP